MSASNNKKRGPEHSRATRKRRRELQNFTIHERGSYDLGFNTFGNTGAKEQQKFIKRIDGDAEWAATRPQIIENLRSQELRSVLLLLSRLHHASLEEDVITIRDPQSLETYLQQRFTKPLLIQSTSSLFGSSQMTWDAFWRFLQSHPEKMVDVYDYSIEEAEKRTERRAVQQVIEHFLQPPDSRTALNCLDIENRLAHCCPLPIIEADLFGRTLQHAESSIGKTDSSWKNSHREFFLASTKNAISNIHVDTAARPTYLYILHGRKIIYFPRKIDMNAVRLLAQVGAEQSQGYDGGWARVELQVGDLFIMPPSCPHAVFTADDSLVVGGHFYTSAHLPSTLEGLRFQEENPQISNETLENGHYEVLTQIFDMFHAVGTPDEIKRAWANCSLFESRPKFKLPEKRTGFISAVKRFATRAKKSFDEELE